MQFKRCPICHARISLSALVQDEAGRELMGLLATLDSDTGRALVGYLGLFRSQSRDLANDKALKLAREALSLAGRELVAAAMRQTVESLQSKPSNGLKNHNYLKRVLEDYLANGFNPVSVQVLKTTPAAPGKTSKTAQALQALEDWGNE